VSDRDAFLRGDRLDDVVIYLSDAAVEGDAEALADRGTRVDDGIVLVLPGDQGRRAFATGTGVEALAFAKRAGGTEGGVERTLDGGACPDADGAGDDPHRVRFLLAFAEGENADVGGRYADGDVVHAYAQCSCGTAYSDRWVAGERAE